MNLSKQLKKIILPFIMVVVFQAMVMAGDTIPNLYDPNSNAVMDIEKAKSLAKSENKHVLVQVGGNWCRWCVKLHAFIGDHAALDSIIRADYIAIYVNYSKENRNPEAMSLLENPQRFGFPVLIVLDENGKRLHTQDTGYLEDGEGYDEKKIRRFLLNWNYAAIHRQPAGK